MKMFNIYILSVLPNMQVYIKLTCWIFIVRFYTNRHTAYCIQNFHFGSLYLHNNVYFCFRSLLVGIAYDRDFAFFALLNIFGYLATTNFKRSQHWHRQPLTVNKYILSVEWIEICNEMLECIGIGYFVHFVYFIHEQLILFSSFI